MPRSRRILTEIYPYHVTARCINKDWFKLPLPLVWDIFSRHLFFCHHAFKAKIRSFVLMNNHFHMLLHTPDANLDKIMWYLMKSVSQEITKTSFRINQTFGAPYFSSVITNNHHYSLAYKYVYRNPVEANICLRAEDYTFSTLAFLLGRQHLLFPLEDDFLLFENIENTLDWLNRSYPANDQSAIKTALTKKQFSLPIDRKTRRRNHLEKEK